MLGLKLIHLSKGGPRPIFFDNRCEFQSPSNVKICGPMAQYWVTIMSLDHKYVMKYINEEIPSINLHYV